MSSLSFSGASTGTQWLTHPKGRGQPRLLRTFRHGPELFDQTSVRLIDLLAGDLHR